MRQPMLVGPLLVVLAAATFGGPASAQTTDGYHAIQVFPVVVDTASFTQRFTFRNPHPVAITVQPKFFPANGVTAVPLVCPDAVIPAGSSSTFQSLRTLCPALASGSQFGFMHVVLKTFDAGGGWSFSGFSRVANPQGNGFSVEAFPAHTFTAATSVVTGIRRLAATAGTPAFQTNCFIGSLNEISAGTPPSAQVHYSLTTAAGTAIAAGDVNVAPGQIVRLLDVFAIAPVGNYDDATVRFEELGAEEPGIVAFCTVQDNTSFGADFRIAKQEVGDPTSGGGYVPMGSQDDHVRRNWRLNGDASGRAFTLGSGNVYNVHVVYFRHPDYVACELTDAAGAVLPFEANLELVLLDDANFPIVNAGFNAFGIYLGDKKRRNNGANARYRIIVEDAEGLFTSVRPYYLHCTSGSGHTLGDLIVQNGNPDIY